MSSRLFLRPPHSHPSMWLPTLLKEKAASEGVSCDVALSDWSICVLPSFRRHACCSTESYYWLNKSGIIFSLSINMLMLGWFAMQKWLIESRPSYSRKRLSSNVYLLFGLLHKTPNHSIMIDRFAQSSRISLRGELSLLCLAFDLFMFQWAMRKYYEGRSVSFHDTLWELLLETMCFHNKLRFARKAVFTREINRFRGKLHKNTF